MKRTKMAIAALCALAFASSAFATIQPTRVGPVSQYGALQSGMKAIFLDTRCPSCDHAQVPVCHTVREVPDIL